MRTRVFTLISKRGYRRSTVGPQFRDLAEIKKYVATPQWSIGDFMEQDTNVQELPSVETVERLLKLSGLLPKDVESLRRKLGHQLVFLDKLVTLDVNEKTDPKNARLLPRNPKPLEYDDLIHAAQNQVKDASLGEISGSWDSVELAKNSKDGFYVLRKAFMKRK
ncbi:LAME_0H17480g1_1 [Lachancea meyersii CBS 8951]|uniref:Glutamyl-tRNA(Gln) amidotransferase subunit F, mitochondrial n=1 Tax=Lachancea meyersii CBS 8951 TaxID=1266667 RepID=A0A1G4KII7_9SACH|nr:LAME_0H17480g1_1 [Lachancea meyersii CBS 8951]